MYVLERDGQGRGPGPRRTVAAMADFGPARPGPARAHPAERHGGGRGSGPPPHCGGCELPTDGIPSLSSLTRLNYIYIYILYIYIYIYLYI